MYELEVPEEKFPEGIATFYLFDNNLKFLSERSVYIKENNLIVKASIDKNVYGKRDKATLSVSVTDASNHPVPSLFTVSVIDTAFSLPSDDCIIPDLNDSRSINNMALAHMQCFDENNMDIVMLIRNNTYQDISKNVINTLPVEEDSLLFIKGKALDEKNNPASGKLQSGFNSLSVIW